MTDGGTLADVATRDRDAAAFCAGEYPRLVAGLSLYVERHVAEELAQEALLRACRHWPRVSRLESPGGWTWRVARNLATSQYRRRLAHRRARQRLRADPSTAHHDPDGAIVEAVRHAVAELPDRQRMAIVLRFAMDLSIEETALRMAATPDSVRSLTKRGSATLRHLLSDDRPASAVSSTTEPDDA